MRSHPARPNREPRASLRRAPPLVPRAPRAPHLSLGGAARQVYLAQTVIAWGVPAAVVGFLVISVVRGARGPKGDPLDDEAPPSPLALAFGKPRTPGEPAELLRIERLNERMESFRYSLRKADEGRRPALAAKRQRDFERAYGIALGGLSEKQAQRLATADQKFREIDQRVLDEARPRPRLSRAPALLCSCTRAWDRSGPGSGAEACGLMWRRAGGGRSTRSHASCAGWRPPRARSLQRRGARTRTRPTTSRRAAVLPLEPLSRVSDLLTESCGSSGVTAAFPPAASRTCCRCGARRAAPRGG